MKILESGEIPPPFGGVTVHLRRLLDYLVDDGFDLTLVARRPPQSLDPKIAIVRWPTLPRYLNHMEFLRGLSKPFGTGVLHLHSNPVFFAPLGCLHIRREGSVLVTVHDQMIDDKLSHALPHERLCFRELTRSARVRWIAVSDPIREFLQERDVAVDRIRVIPAYLPERHDETASALPQRIEAFLHEHQMCMVVYGYRRDFLSGRDLYGFDFSIEVLVEVLRSIPNAGLIILCPDAQRDSDSWQQLAGEAATMGVSSNVLFFLEPVAAPLSLWRRCRVMLRPSLTDGDSIAVREMLSLGRPVIASDVVPRPAGAKVLPLESTKHWATAVLDYVRQPDSDQHESGLAGNNYFAVKDMIMASLADVS